MHETKHWSVWSIHSSHMEICIKVVNGYGQVHSMSPILYETVHRDPPPKSLPQPHPHIPSLILKSCSPAKATHHISMQGSSTFTPHANTHITYIHTYASHVDTNMPFHSTDAILMHSHTIHRDTLGNSTDAILMHSHTIHRDTLGNSTDAILMHSHTIHRDTLGNSTGAILMHSHTIHRDTLGNSTGAILMHSHTIHWDTLGNSTREFDPKYCSNNSSAINRQQHGFPQSTKHGRTWSDSSWQHHAVLETWRGCISSPDRCQQRQWTWTYYQR